MTTDNRDPRGSAQSLIDMWNQGLGKLKAASLVKLPGLDGKPRYSVDSTSCPSLHCKGTMHFDLAKYAHECDQCGFLLLHPMQPAFAEQPYAQLSTRQPTDEETAAMRKHFEEPRQLPKNDNKVTVTNNAPEAVRTQSVQTGNELKISMHEQPSKDDLMVTTRVSERFLEILGLKGQHVESLSIDFAFNELIRVHATMYVSREQMDNMEKALIAYNLVPDPELKEMLK